MKKERNTKQKDILLEFFSKNANKHLSIKEIESSLQGKVGLTTIYRMINSLAIKGQIVKIPLDDKQGFCYQYRQNKKKCNSHYHLICEKCGKLEHFECKDVDNAVVMADECKSFSINTNKIVFYGTCKDCR